MKENIAVREALELHSLLNFKTLCAVKAKTMIPLVTDPRLKGLMIQCLDKTMDNISELEDIIEQNSLTV